LKNLALNWARDHHREIPIDPRPPKPIEAEDAGRVHTLEKMPVNLPHVDWEADDPHPKEDPAHASEDPDPREEDRHRPRNDEEVERDEMWELCSRHMEAVGTDRDKLVAIYYFQKDMTREEVAKELKLEPKDVEAALKRIRRSVLAAAETDP